MKQTVKTSRAAGQLEKMFRELNKHYFAGKLPEPIISLKKTPSAYGHITCSKVWQAGGENKYEINISSATLDRPIEETASTLLHEMVHIHLRREMRRNYERTLIPVIRSVKHISTCGESTELKHGAHF